MYFTLSNSEVPVCMLQMRCLTPSSVGFLLYKIALFLKLYNGTDNEGQHYDRARHEARELWLRVMRFSERKKRLGEQHGRGDRRTREKQQEHWNSKEMGYSFKGSTLKKKWWEQWIVLPAFLNAWWLSNCTKHCTYIILLNPQNNNHFSLISFELRKLRHREVDKLAQGHS